MPDHSRLMAPLRLFRRRWCVPIAFLAAAALLLDILVVRDLQYWDYRASRNLSSYVQYQRNTSLTSPWKFALTTGHSPRSSYDVLIVVCSKAENIRHRHAVRHTWGAAIQNKTLNGGLKVAVVFLLGLDLDQAVNARTLSEATEFGDVIIEDVVESYYNLTIKSILMLKSASSTSLNSTFLFKVDDDSHIRVGSFAKLLHKHRSTLMGQISGFLYHGESPVRWAFRYMDENVKWLCPRWLFPNSTFPSYVAGMGYILPTWMLSCLLDNSSKTEFLYLEDVFLTGILATMCSFERGQPPGFHHSGRKHFVDSDHVLLHYVSPDRQIALFQESSQ